MAKSEHSRKRNKENKEKGLCQCGKERAFLSLSCQRCLDTAKLRTKKNSGKKRINGILAKNDILGYSTKNNPNGFIKPENWNARFDSH